MRRISGCIGVLAAVSLVGMVLAGPSAAADPTTIKCAEKATYEEFQACMKDAADAVKKQQEAQDQAAAAYKEAEEEAKKACEEAGGRWLDVQLPGMGSQCTQL